ASVRELSISSIEMKIGITFRGMMNPATPKPKRITLKASMCESGIMAQALDFGAATFRRRRGGDWPSPVGPALLGSKGAIFGNAGVAARGGGCLPSEIRCSASGITLQPQNSFFANTTA